MFKKTPSVDRRELVEALYRVALGREPENEEVIEERATREQPATEILASFLESDEGRQKRIKREDLVLALYRTLLNREPENDAVLAAWSDSDAPLSEMIKTFAFGDEAVHGPWNQVLNKFLAENASRKGTQIDVHVTPDQLDRMFQRVQTEWSKLGETDPFWSVLTSDDYRKDSIEAHLNAFLETGQDAVDQLFTLTARTEVSIDPSSTVIDFGCGVGRLSLALAQHFEKVVGVDISPGNLREARALASAQGVSNLDFVQMEQVTDITTVPECDLLYTVIVLQHNPPPIQHFMLDVLLSKVRSGGHAFFQIPTHAPDYSFSADEYLDTDLVVMEMHALPMHHVFALLEKHGFVMNEVYQDYATAMAGSHSFFATRKKH